MTTIEVKLLAPFSIFLLIPTLLQGKNSPAAYRKLSPTSTAPEELVRSRAAWIAADFQAASSLKLYSLAVFRTSTRRRIWMQKTSGRGASQHSDGSGATASAQHLLMTTLSQLTGSSRSTRPARVQSSLLWKWFFFLANPNEDKSIGTFPMPPRSLNFIENKLCIQI